MYCLCLSQKWHLIQVGLLIIRIVKLQHSLTGLRAICFVGHSNQNVAYGLGQRFGPTKHMLPLISSINVYAYGFSCVALPLTKPLNYTCVNCKWITPVKREFLKTFYLASFCILKEIEVIENVVCLPLGYIAILIHFWRNRAAFEKSPHLIAFGHNMNSLIFFLSEFSAGIH